MGALRQGRHQDGPLGHRCASRRADRQRRDRCGQVIVATIAVVSGLALAGCQTVALPSLNLNTAVSLNTVYGIENAFGVAVNAANAYKALPLCRTGTEPGVANICTKRSVIKSCNRRCARRASP